MDKKELKAQAKAQKAQLKAEAKARKAEIKAQKQEAAKQKRIAHRYTMMLDQYLLNGEKGTLETALPKRVWELQGAKAQLIEGHVANRSTATRVLGGAVLGGGAGAVVGAVAKKTTGGHVVIVDFADGDFIEIKVKPEKIAQAQKFVMNINAVGAREVEAPAI